MPSRMIAAICVAVLLVAVALATSCSKSAALAADCSINSDCNSPLICAFGRCHNECTATRDCPTGERCVISGTTGVCELPQESACNAAKPCPTGLLCATDEQCRTPCLMMNQCAGGQVCEPQPLSLAGACFDPSEVDGGDAGALDGAGRGDGSGGDSASPDGGGRDTGTADGPHGGFDSSVTDLCTSAQTQFGFTATGDSNPAFTSGVGVRTATQLLIYSAYAGAAPAGFDGGAGDAGSTNIVYEQAFDPGTAASLAPAHPLFQVASGQGFVLVAAAVAPNGQVALLYGYGGFWNYTSFNGQAGLWAAFVGGAPDAGTTGLQLVQLESTAVFGQAHAIWSDVAQAFVFSWEYSQPGGGPYHLKVARSLANGQPAGGGTDLLPTDDPNGDVYYYNNNYDQGAVGSTGAGPFGVAYLNVSQDFPALTVLDAVGNQLGLTVEIPSGGVSNWVTVGGASNGLAYLFDSAQGITATFLPVTADGGPPPLPDGGTYPSFVFPGMRRAIVAHGIGDDKNAGAGGAGAVILYNDEVDFVYVNAGGASHVGPSSVISHTYAAGDIVSGMNYAGSFGVSIYESATHQTQMAASGCPQ